MAFSKTDYPYFSKSGDQSFGGLFTNAQQRWSGQTLIWTYKTEDSEGTVNAENYFILIADFLALGDRILVARVTDRGTGTEALAGSHWVEVQTLDGTTCTTATVGSGAVDDHGGLSGLDDNDHGAIYYTKTEVDALEWAATDITSLTFADARISETSVTQHEAALDHDALVNFVANEHLDWTSTTANFSTSGTAATGALSVTGDLTISGTVAGRAPATDGTKLDGIESGATADQTGAEVVSLVDTELGAATWQTGSTVITVADATALVASTEQTLPVKMLCYTSSDDGGGGWFEARESGDTVDYGTIMTHGSGGNWRFHRIGITSTEANVCWWGIVYDDSASGAEQAANVVAIQRALDYLESFRLPVTATFRGLVLHIPNGGAAIGIDDYLNVKSTSESIQIVSNLQVIKQYTNDTPIFLFTADHDYPTTNWVNRFVKVSGLCFVYNENQVTAVGGPYTNGICLAMTNWPAHATSTPSGVMQGLHAHNIRAMNHYFLMAEVVSGKTESPVDGGFYAFLKLEDIYLTGGGGLIKIVSPLAGSPHFVISRIYGQYHNMVTPIINLTSTSAAHIRDVEVNDTTGRCIQIGNIGTVVLENIAFERAVMDTDDGYIHCLSSGASPVIRNISFINSTVNAGVTATIVQAYDTDVVVDGKVRVRNIEHNTTGVLQLAGVASGGSGSVRWKSDVDWDSTTGKLLANGTDNVVYPNAIILSGLLDVPEDTLFVETELEWEMPFDGWVKSHKGSVTTALSTGTLNVRLTHHNGTSWSPLSNPGPFYINGSELTDDTAALPPASRQFGVGDRLNLLANRNTGSVPATGNLMYQVVVVPMLLQT